MLFTDKERHREAYAWEDATVATIVTEIERRVVMWLGGDPSVRAHFLLEESLFGLIADVAMADMERDQDGACVDPGARLVAALNPDASIELWKWAVDQILDRYVDETLWVAEAFLDSPGGANVAAMAGISQDYFMNTGPEVTEEALAAANEWMRDYVCEKWAGL